MKALCALVFCCLTKEFFCQTNLVFNPGFETYTTCPSGFGEMYYATGWDVCNSGTPDYLNPCTTNTSLSTPANAYGYQAPFDGNCYAGLLTYPIDREIITGQLISSLTVSQKYYISLMVNHADLNVDNTYSTNKMGVKLFKVRPSTIPINNSAMYSSNAVITDAASWTQLFGSFIADSAYNYLAIGNFFDDNNTTVTVHSHGRWAFYFIDGVCISQDSAFTRNFATNIKEHYSAGSDVKIFPNPASNFITITSQNPTPNINYSLLNKYGQLILNGIIHNGDSIDLRNLAEDLYIIHVTCGKLQYYDKILVRH